MRGHTSCRACRVLSQVNKAVPCHEFIEGHATVKEIGVSLVVHVVD